VLLAACQQPPAPPPVTSAAAPVAQLRAEGDALMARGDYAGAVEKFRQATDLEPTSVTLRFALGIAYSFLDRRPEAIAQLRWVVANAAADSVEYQEARRWLVRVGVLIESSPLAGKPEPTSTDAASKKVDPAVQGWVDGQTQWPGVSPTAHQVPIRISLVGTEDATRQVRLRRDVFLGERFEFKEVPEGQYRLLGIFDDRIVWDQSVTVKTGKGTDIALTQGLSPVPADTFPIPGEPVFR
jgi:tetratricopeptide (TPR) repeat protein